MKGIDWQMVSFVGLTLFHEYITCRRLPKVYYWNRQFMK